MPFQIKKSLNPSNDSDSPTLFRENYLTLSNDKKLRNLTKKFEPIEENLYRQATRTAHLTIDQRQLQFDLNISKAQKEISHKKLKVF